MMVGVHSDSARIEMKGHFCFCFWRAQLCLASASALLRYHGTLFPGRKVMSMFASFVCGYNSNVKIQLSNSHL